MDNFIDKIVVIASISLIFSLYGVLAIRTSNYIPEATNEHRESFTAHYYLAYLEHTKLKVLMYSIPKKLEYAGRFEEEVSEEMNCLFYATEPIGRYYITAYNHEETGSKITASGKTCHEGTITTCAIDPKLHRFGEYFEITVNGEPRLFVAEDTGRLVKKRHIDLYFASYKAMARYGSNYQTIYKVTFPFGKPKGE